MTSRIVIIGGGQAGGWAAKTLRDEGFISDTGDAEPEETMKVYQMLAELITADVRLTIESSTQGE